MPRPTKQNPERGDARTRLLEAARDVIRTKGFTATTVSDLCTAAGVTSGAFFHNFKSKQALGAAAAEYWSETTAEFFRTAPYHALADPLERVLGYIDFRKAIIEGEISQFTCLAGTMAQEIYDTQPDIRAACGASILDHAATLEPDIEAAMKARGLDADFSPASLARHTQVVLQGAFILAKATGARNAARESVDHLRRYVELLFDTGCEHHKTA